MRKKNQRFSLNTIWSKDKIRLCFPKLAVLRSFMLCSRRSISALCNQFYLDQVWGAGTENTAELETKVWTPSTFLSDWMWIHTSSSGAASSVRNASTVRSTMAGRSVVFMQFTKNWKVNASPLKTLTAVLTAGSLKSHFMCSGVRKRQTSRINGHNKTSPKHVSYRHIAEPFPPSDTVR